MGALTGVWSSCLLLPGQVISTGKGCESVRPRLRYAWENQSAGLGVAEWQGDFYGKLCLRVFSRELGRQKYLWFGGDEDS